MSVISDASGSWGCGAFISTTNDWFQFKWPSTWLGASIAVKEMFPVVVSAALWGGQWCGASVQFICDNLSVVQALSSGRVKDVHLLHLLRCSFFLSAHFGFSHTAAHIPGKDNLAADALSRNRRGEFFAIHPSAPQIPAAIPASLCSLLSSPDLQWTDSRWRELFTAALHDISRV